MQDAENNNLIVDLSFDFALKIIEFAYDLEQDRKYIIARQVLKSGTSIGANIREAQNAESRSDFIHKLKMSAKEADETAYWLMLCNNSKIYNINCEDLITTCNSIRKILSKIIATTKQNANSNSSLK